MISSLEISGLGVIDRAEVELGAGLTVLTGETGAGKTMILTSLELLLGGRADPGTVRIGFDRADVDGVFLIDNDARELLEDTGAIIEDGELIVSRTVSTQGRSKARLGGRPVPASVLAEAVSPLVTIHGQSDQIRLTSPAHQRDLVDAFGGEEHRAILEEYAAAWLAAVELKRELDEVERDFTDREDEIRRLSEITERIEAFDPQPGEDEELRLEARRLTNVEDLRAYVARAVAALTAEDENGGAVQLSRRAFDEARSGALLDEGLRDIASRLDSVVIDIDTIADDLRAYSRSLDADPARLNEIQNRRAELKTLLDGRAEDAEGLLAWNERALERLRLLTNPGSDPASVRARLEQAQARVLEVGAKLSASRRRLADRLATAVDTELHALSMPDARIEIRIEAARPTSSGLDEVAILLQPHPSASPRPIGQGASGGELSRIMLAIEVVLGNVDRAQTFVFDEIDAGIGGRTATEVGARLARLARDRQVVVVTHLAQVAVFAQTHIVVAKSDGTTTLTTVEGREREAELTRMMGGDPHSDAARRHAIEVLSSAVPQSQ